MTLSIALPYHGRKVSQIPKDGVQGDQGRCPLPAGVNTCVETENALPCSPPWLLQWERRAGQSCLLLPLNGASASRAEL